MWLEKLTLQVGSGEIGDLFSTDIQYAYAKAVPLQIFGISQNGDVQHVRDEAPWLVPALEQFGERLRVRGFADPLRVIGHANHVADRLYARVHASPYLSHDDFNMTAAMAWYHKGCEGRDWFFHVVIGVALPEKKQVDCRAKFLNSLDANGAHLKPLSVMPLS